MQHMHRRFPSAEEGNLFRLDPTGQQETTAVARFRNLPDQSAISFIPLAPGTNVVVLVVQHRIHIIEDKQTAMIAQVLKRSEEHTSELQSQFHIVCRLLLEK